MDDVVGLGSRIRIFSVIAVTFLAPIYSPCDISRLRSVVCVRSMVKSFSKLRMSQRPNRDGL